MNLAVDILLVSFAAHVVAGSLDSAPDNAVTEVGQNVTFRCRTNATSRLAWLLKGLDQRVPQHVIFNGSHVSAKFTRYTVPDSSVPGQYDLHIRNARMSDAGIFTCVELDTGANVSALLAVIDPNAYCNSTATDGVAIDGDPIDVTCFVTYNGSLWQRPQLTWYDNDTVVINNVSHVTNPNTAVWSSVSLVAELPRISSYRLETHFTVPVPSVDQPPCLSQRVPNYNRSWRTPVINVVPPGMPQGVTDKPVAAVVVSILVVVVVLLVTFLLLHRRCKRLKEAVRYSAIDMQHILPAATVHVDSSPKYKKI